MISSVRFRPLLPAPLRRERLPSYNGAMQRTRSSTVLDLLQYFCGLAGWALVTYGASRFFGSIAWVFSGGALLLLCGYGLETIALTVWRGVPEGLRRSLDSRGGR